MTTHSREDKGLGTPGFELVAKRFHDFLIMREPTAAGSDADALAFEGFCRCRIQGQELFFQDADGIGQICMGE